MYGLVNRAVEDLVVSSAGHDVWNDICERAGLDSPSFEAMESYDDAVTYSLVCAASEVLGASPEDILEGFGRHWILYTGAEGWGPILDSQGSSVSEVISNLNNMHIRIQATMPSLVMPEFVVKHADETHIVFEYHSEREGLAPMVLGLMRGLAERCDEAWDIEHAGHRDRDGFDTFELNARVPAST